MPNIADKTSNQAANKPPATLQSPQVLGQKQWLAEFRPQVCEPIKLGMENKVFPDKGADEASMRMVEIREMLIHAAMTILERSERIAEYVRLADGDDMVGHDDPPPAGGRQPHDKGIRRAARDLEEAFPRKSEEARRMHIRRTVEVASISPQAKNAAIEKGLANRLTSLQLISQEPTPEKQVQKVNEIAKEIKSRARASRDGARRAAPNLASQEIEILKAKVAEREKTIVELTTRNRILEAELDAATKALTVSQHGSGILPPAAGNPCSPVHCPDLPASLDRRHHNAERDDSSEAVVSSSATSSATGSPS